MFCFACLAFNKGFQLFKKKRKKKKTWQQEYSSIFHFRQKYHEQNSTLNYVDDMIIIGDDLSGIQELKDFLSQQFEMKDFGHLSYFLDLEITHSIDRLYITQVKYASELLSQVGLTDSKTVDTFIELNVQEIPLIEGQPLVIYYFVFVLL